MPLLRLHNRAWLCRINGYGVVFAVGAGALTRPLFSTAQLEPHRNKGAFQKRRARLSSPVR